VVARCTAIYLFIIYLLLNRTRSTEYSMKINNLRSQLARANVRDIGRLISKGKMLFSTSRPGNTNEYAGIQGLQVFFPLDILNNQP